MANKAIALIVAGSGGTDIEEVTDLLNDAYPEDKFDVDLMVPVSKSYFTDTVQNVVDWYGNDSAVYPFRVDGENPNRAGAALGPADGTTHIETLTDIFNPDDFADWDEVHVLIALPEDEESPEFDLYAGVAEAAIDAGFPVKNLAQALDDVTLSEEDSEPEPEPEPEPEEKPKRTRRKKAEEPEPDPEPEPEEPKKDHLESLNSRLREEKSAQAVTEEEDAVRSALDDLVKVVEFLENNDKMFALRNMADEVIFAPLTLAAGTAVDVLTKAFVDPKPTEAPAEPQEANEAPKRGRGRPRTNFEVKEIFDEDEGEWIPRPKGRVKKGTKWRVRHDETNEVLDEGTV